jgi:hypothetical protein
MPHWNQGIVSEVRIEGYADERRFMGTYGNFRLSLDRATTAYIHIVENYDIPTRSVSASGYGDTRPLEWREGESREDWLQRNRRVEFVLVRNFLLNEETGLGLEQGGGYLPYDTADQPFDGAPGDNTIE